MRWLLFILLFPFAASAQGVATLVADSVEVTADGRLVATGNVEALYDGTRLSARRITYDQTSDRLTIDGPLFITTTDGALLMADRASLDPQLENGLLRGARLVLDQRLQLAANRIDRVDGKFSQLSQVAVTSCQVCGTQSPLWEIRAARVVHDQDEQQLYFDDATLLVRGVPVFWLPYMRLPDPTLPRATGFLMPSIRNNDQLGTGLKIPYFIRLGDHQDLTLTPYLSSETSTLEARYRLAFASGDILVNGAYSEDVLFDDPRSYLFLNGDFDLGRDYQLSFNFQAVSDPAYLLDYGYDDRDRLESQFAIIRVLEDDLLQAQVTYFESLRDDEADNALPPVVARISYGSRTPLIDGSVVDYEVSTDAGIRTNTQNPDDARDFARFGARLSWQKDWVMQSGVLASLSSGIKSNRFFVNDDPTEEISINQTVPHAAITLRWPLSRQTRLGGTDILEPILALAWSKQIGGTPPNEDSTRTELDQSNLYAISRFAGDDRTELGLRAAAGFNWTRTRANGIVSVLSFGRVIRETEDDSFTTSSGLTGITSDWVIAGQINMPSGFYIEGRTLYDESFDMTLGSARVNWQRDDVAVAASYIWQAADSAENRAEAVSEWQVDTSVQFTDAWKISFDGRYDLAARQPDRAGLGIEWQNECATVNLSVSRRFTSSTTVNPSTDYGLSFSLNGFSTGRSSVGPAARCTQ